MGAEEVLLVRTGADLLQRRGDRGPGALQAHRRAVRRRAAGGGQAEQYAPAVGIEPHRLHHQQPVRLAHLPAQAAAAEAQTYNYIN